MVKKKKKKEKLYVLIYRSKRTYKPVWLTKKELDRGYARYKRALGR